MRKFKQETANQFPADTMWLERLIGDPLADFRFSLYMPEKAGPIEKILVSGDYLGFGRIEIVFSDWEKPKEFIRKLKEVGLVPAPPRRDPISLTLLHEEQKTVKVSSPKDFVPFLKTLIAEHPSIGRKFDSICAILGIKATNMRPIDTNRFFEKKAESSSKRSLYSEKGNKPAVSVLEISSDSPKTEIPSP